MHACISQPHIKDFWLTAWLINIECILLEIIFVVTFNVLFLSIPLSFKKTSTIQCLLWFMLLSHVFYFFYLRTWWFFNVVNIVKANIYVGYPWTIQRLFPETGKSQIQSYSNWNENIFNIKIALWFQSQNRSLINFSDWKIVWKIWFFKK